MSRIGKNPVIIPDGVKVELLGQLVKVTGPKGSLEFNAHKDMKISKSDNSVLIERQSDERLLRSLHGTTRQMINNMVIGVSEGYFKELEIIGVGYIAMVQGSRLQLQLGYSHDIFFDMPDGITITANRTEVKVDGIDKQLVGAVAAKIRSFRKPEPYKGKGIRFVGEHIRRKAGKSAAK